MKAMLKSGSTEKSATASNGRSAQRRKIADAFGSLADAPRTIAQRKQIEGAFGSAIQRQVEEEEPLQGKLKTAQFAGLEEEEPMQGKFEPVQRATGESSAAPAPNRTGMPDHLKAGIESMSGLSMDNVKVHYGSSQPAQLNALAYAQGSDIHIAPGQEHHLPHEAWHVVQQAQGRVQPTMQLNEGVPVNDDAGLEKEADVMGEKASRVGY
jgi:hypothetical protein